MQPDLLKRERKGLKPQTKSSKRGKTAKKLIKERKIKERKIKERKIKERKIKQGK